MPTPPKPNEIPVFLKEEDRGKVSFVFDDDRDKKIPYDVTLYLKNKNNDNDTGIAIGTAATLSENVFYFEDEDDNDNTGNYLYDAGRLPIGFVKNLTNKIYIKQPELVGGGKKKKAKKTKKAKKSKKAKKTQRKSIRSRRRRR